jgi:hypothetical protein
VGVASGYPALSAVCHGVSALAYIRLDPAYEEYRMRTDRKIPVILLQPTHSGSDSST